MGHASVAITFDRHGHLMPGNEAEAAALLDATWSERTCRSRAAEAQDRRLYADCPARGELEVDRA